MNYISSYLQILALVCLTSLALGETEIYSPAANLVMKGDNVTLSCRQTNCLDVVWYQDATKIDSIFNSGITIFSHKEPARDGVPCMAYSNLTITNVKVEHANKYSCREQLRQGEETYYVRVYVVEIHNRNGYLMHGKNATLRCQVDGVTDYRPILWWRSGQQITPDGEKYIVSQRNNSLLIVNPNVNDIGEYLCGFNLNGVTYNQTVNLAADPFVFPFEAKSKHFAEGYPMFLDCKAGGFPLPTVSWLKEGLPIDTSDPRVSFDELDGVENATLWIENLNYSDKANYTCIATNSDGVSSSATILVQVKGDGSNASSGHQISSRFIFSFLIPLFIFFIFS